MSFVPTGVPGVRPRTADTLFTVTPAAELDQISRWARLADAASCGQVRAVVAAQDLISTALLAASLPGLAESVEALTQKL